MGNEKKELEQRFYDAKLDALDGRDNAVAGTVRGVPVVFNSRANLGEFDEIIEPGALTGTDLTDVRLCLNHDTSYVYARSRRNQPNSTMRLAVTDRGLEIEADLDIEGSPRAKDLYSAIRLGNIDHMSFMFSVDEDRWDDLASDHPTRHITKIGSIVEVSAVTVPAYSATSIDARSKEALDNARAQAALDSAKAAEGNTLDSVDETRSLDLEKAKTHILATFKIN